MIARTCLGALAALAISMAAQAQDAAQPATPPVAAMPAQAAATSANPWDRIHTVAVVSGIGTKLLLVNDHQFANDTKPVDIASWNIDAQVTAALKSYLGSRFTFTDVKYDPAAVAQLPSGEWDTADHGVRAFDGTLAADGVDAFIIVRPSSDKSTPGPAGLALENRYAADPRPVEWADYEIDIVDAKTFAVLAHAQSRIQPRAGTPASFAAVMGAKDLAPSSDLTLSDAQRAALQDDFARLVSQSLTETVRALNLNVPLPAMGARDLVAMAPGQDPFASIKTIAIASAIGDALEMKQWSTITLTDKQVPIADWHIDDQVEALAKDAMGKRFTIAAGNIDRAALASTPVIDARGHVEATLPGLQPDNAIDAYVLFLKMPLSGEPAGVGMTNSDTLFGGDAQTDLFANYAIAVIDAHTLKPIVIDQAATSPRSAAATPTEKVDHALWPAEIGNPTPAEAAKIHQALSDLLADSVPETLLRMGLTGMTIAGAAPSQTPAQ
jgi:hypothetical protein